MSADDDPTRPTEELPLHGGGGVYVVQSSADGGVRRSRNSVSGGLSEPVKTAAKRKKKVWTTPSVWNYLSQKWMYLELKYI